MEIVFNNKKMVTTATSLLTLLKETSIAERKGIAVAVNNELVQRDCWEAHFLKENDKITVITATQGG